MPSCRRWSSSSGGRSTSSISSARSSTESGTVSRTMTPVILATTSFRLSTCWTFIVGVDVDAGVEQLEHVLPALGVPRARRVGVRELVDEDQRGPARERGVEVELLQRRPAIGDQPRRQDLEALEQRLGLGAPVGLDVADDDVDARRALERAGGLEHRVGLADAGGGAEEELERARAACRASSSLTRASRASGSGRCSCRRSFMATLGCLACLRASSRPRIDAAIVRVRASSTSNP